MRDTNRVVVITGAAGGIGRATAISFASRQCKLVLVDIAPAGLNNLADEIKAKGGNILICQGDLMDLSFARSIIDQAANQWGRIDVLVNNAAWRTIETMRSMSVETWEKTLKVCLTTPAFLAKWTAELMEKNETGGVILNVSSVMAVRPGGTSPAYIASKGGLESLTYELSALYGPAGIRVLAICPGNVISGMSMDYTNPGKENISKILEDHMSENTALKRPGSPEEIANVLYWLSTPDASFITGTTIFVDGGFLHNFNSYQMKRIQFPKEF